MFPQGTSTLNTSYLESFKFCKKLRNCFLICALLVTASQWQEVWVQIHVIPEIRIVYTTLHHLCPAGKEI